MTGYVLASAGQAAVESAGKTAVQTAAGQVVQLKGLEGALFISVVDMAVVFSVLGIIALVMVFLAKAVRAVEVGAEPKEASVPSPATAPVAASGKDEIDDETVAAISAAVAAVMAGKRYRIARLSGYDIQTARWAMAGRQKLLMKG